MHPINGGSDSLLSLPKSTIYIQAKRSQSAYMDRELKDQNTQFNEPPQKKKTSKKARDYHSKEKKIA
jgi:hypothetical protein